MKAFLYKAKGVLALTLALSMSGVQAFAVEPLSAEEQGAKPAPVVVLTEEEIAAMQLPQLTYEEALKKAKKHSPELRQLQNTAEYLEETRGDLWDMGIYSLPNYDYQRWVNAGWWQAINGFFQVDQQTKQTAIGREMQEMVLEMTVLSSFTTILNDQDTLRLTEKNAEIQKTLYQQGQRKYQLGMISKYQLDKLKATSDQMENTVALLKATLEQEYIDLNEVMGEKTETRFEFVHDITFEPFTMHQTMEQYINAEMKRDLTIKLKEMAVESAKFGKNFLSDTDTGSTSAQKELTLDQAKSDLKAAKSKKEAAIRNAYLQIQQIETAYASAQVDLEKAQADLRATELYYQVGNVTKLTLQQTELAVISAENALKQSAYNHDLVVYSFENPSLLS